MTDTTDGFESGADGPLWRRLREEGARVLPLGGARELLRPFGGGWYTECVRCGDALDGTYYVERALRRDEPLFEFALCERCVMGFGLEMSDDSVMAIGNFWLRHCDVDAREARLEAASDAGSLVDTCLLSGEPRAALDEVQVWAWCRGDQVVADLFGPAVVSGAMMERLGEGLSRQTRDAMDDFVRDHLGLPPELCRMPVLV